MKSPACTSLGFLSTTHRCNRITIAPCRRGFVRSSAGASTWLGVALVATFLAMNPARADEPLVRSKAQAPADLRAVFEDQDDVERRVSGEGFRLRGRALSPVLGVDPALSQTEISATHPALAILRMDRFPSSGEWRTWRDDGIEYVAYLGQKHWVVRLSREADDALSRTQAVALIAYRPADKIYSRLDTFADKAAFFDAEEHLLVVNLRLLATTSEHEVAQIRNEFHRVGLAYVDESNGTTDLTLVTEPHQIDLLASLGSVVEIRPGVWHAEVLMDGVRAVAHAEDIIAGDGTLLTGEGVRAATNEPFGTLWRGSEHEAFWNHDPLGHITTPRWTDLAGSSKCGSITDPTHGIMTAGVLLGNGWWSQRYGGESMGFRGIAPKATYECYSNPGAQAHVSSHSYVASESVMNRAIVGEWTEQRHHPHTVALGNNGLNISTGCPGGTGNAIGYYSACNAQKNALGVANAQVTGEIYADSSAGPTIDGRIKPDISAPTGNTNDTRVGERGGYAVDIHRVEIVRNGQTLLDWNYLFSTREGWGETNLGSPNVEVLPLHGRIRVNVNEEPWGTKWASLPRVGTEEDRFGNRLADLDIVGQEDDVLRVTYRASDLGYFDLAPIWFRDHPYLGDNCNVPDSTCPWHSQSRSGGIGIGDGVLRTMEVPIGLSGDWNIVGDHPYWSDEQTWAGENIEFLGFALGRTKKQPTPSYTQYYNGSSGGTSGASPVLGGAYALAMENLVRLYGNVDLDQKTEPSVYFAPSAPHLVSGMPFNSTWKALFVHTADDMIRLAAGPGTPPNPDTGVPNVYHAGPDYTTGYGMVNIESAIELMNKDAMDEPLFEVLEADLPEGAWHTYTLEVSDVFAAGNQGLKVTMAWDDSPASNSLVNNLSLLLQAPDGTKYYPWSLNVPPVAVAPGDVVPAQRDQPNDRDNIEQVRIDDVKVTHGGTWKIHVTESGFGDPMFEQRYSLVVSPWGKAASCLACD